MYILKLCIATSDANISYVITSTINTGRSGWPVTSLSRFFWESKLAWKHMNLKKRRMRHSWDRIWECHFQICRYCDSQRTIEYRKSRHSYAGTKASLPRSLWEWMPTLSCSMTRMLKRVGLGKWVSYFFFLTMDILPLRWNKYTGVSGRAWIVVLGIEEWWIVSDLLVLQKDECFIFRIWVVACLSSTHGSELTQLLVHRCYGYLAYRQSTTFH